MTAPQSYPTAYVKKAGLSTGVRATLDNDRLHDPSNVLGPIAQTTNSCSIHRARRLADILLASLLHEITTTGLLKDFLGYPYEGFSRRTRWDFREEDGVECIVGLNRAMRSTAVRYVTSDLQSQGFVVHGITFGEERLVPLQWYKGMRGSCKGLGLTYHLA